MGGAETQSRPVPPDEGQKLLSAKVSPANSGAVAVAESVTQEQPKAVNPPSRHAMVLAAIRGTLEKVGPAEERIMDSLRECEKFRDLFPPHTLMIGVGSGESRLREGPDRPPERERQLLALMAKCPTGHTVLRNTRLMFSDWEKFLRLHADDDDPNGFNLLPMSEEDVLEFRNFLLDPRPRCF